MRRTPQYQLPFNQTGDLYSASADRERMVVVDNQLYDLSEIVGDGVLEGWTVSPAGGLVITVAKGKGFISSVMHETLSSKNLTLLPNVESIIYMRSNMFSGSGGFPISVEGPPSNRASASFTDTTIPADPTGLAASAVEFDVINLTWDANGESDLSHYIVQRADDAAFTVNLVTLGLPTTNGTLLAPFVSSGLSEQTTYYYRVRAVDNSGNQSAGWSTSFAATPMDSTKPTDPRVLQLYPGKNTMGVIFEASQTTDVVSHELTYYRLNSDGSIAATFGPYSIAVPVEIYQAGIVDAPLINGYKHRFIVKAVRSNGIKSDGITQEETPYDAPSPMDVSGLTATALAAGIQLSWAASASLTGSSIGQKSQYRIRVIDPSWIESAPLSDVGLSLSRIVSSYFVTADVGLGERTFLEEGKRYGFRVTTVDPFGNESGGALVRATTLDLTAPTGPRTLAAAAGDGQAVLTWNHSTSPDVVGYVLNVNTGAGFGPDINLSYVTTYTVGSLTNGTLTTFRLKAVDSSSPPNSSSYITTTATPEPDTTPPPVPQTIRAEIGDESMLVTWSPSSADDFDHFVVWRRQVTEPVNTPPNLSLTTIAGTEIFANVTGPEFYDVSLTNGGTYAYAIKAVDTSGNESDYSGVTLASPSEGMNADPMRLEAPTSLSATPNLSDVSLLWAFSYPGQYYSGGWIYPDGGPTDFNVYRSTNQYFGYQFLASVPSSQWTYDDSTVASTQAGPVTYWYVVTAVRDNASPIADTGGIAPSHSIPLATVVTDGTSATSISNEQRVVENLYATLVEETNKKLILHKHSVKPTNSTTVTALGTLPAIDVSTLGTLSLSAYGLSGSAQAYYDGLKSKASTFSTGTTWTIHPSAVVGNVPRVRDFQFLVAGVRPSVSYVLDDANNVVVLSSPVNGTKTFDGQRINYYVPAGIDLNYRGYDVQVDGVNSATAQVDEENQVVRFSSLVGEASVVTLVIEPAIPDFGTQQGSRQVSLSPNIVLNDFITQNQATYTSESGGFDDTDTVFALVNGLRTSLDYYVDFSTKSVVFGSALPVGTGVALEIVNREEVQGFLPEASLAGIDASQVKTGKLLKAQLPGLSHSGRIKERAWPIFTRTATTNWYTFTGAEVGTGSTPYSFVGLLSGGVLMGTSNGLLKSYLSSGILASPTDNLNVSSGILSSLPILPSSLVAAATYAEANTSGRVRGTVNGVMMPSCCVLNDGRVLVTGGGVYDALGRLNLGVASCSIYDPTSGLFSAADQMSTDRIYHTCTLLPSGKVVVTGGKTYPADAYVLDTTPYPNGLAPAWTHASCEVYDPGTGLWTTIDPMTTARYNHSANLLPDSPYDMVVAGGTTAYNAAFPVEWDEIPATSTTTGYTDERYWTVREIASAERMTLASFTWAATGDLNDASEIESSVVDGSISVTGDRNRELYDATDETWSATSIDQDTQNKARVDVNEPIKQMMIGSDGYVYAVGRNSVYVSTDEGTNFIKMSGLDSVGVVHKIIETADETLMAATDMGVYAITSDIRAAMTWFAGGLIGAGTTETFDMVEYGTGSSYGNPKVLASTEIGIYETSDAAETWTLVVEVDDVRNIELLGSVLYATVGQAIYRSLNGTTWSRISEQSIIDESSVLLARSNIELLLGTTTGLYWSSDGMTFSLVSFNRNRDPDRNAVFMLDVSGGDVIVGYEDSLWSLDAAHNALRISEFGGTIPTVKVNGEVSKGGYRYDVTNNQVVFEFKRLADDYVDVASSYSLFALEGGSWYHQNPDAPYQVYVGGSPVETGYVGDAWSGQIAFSAPLTKFDPVTVSVYGTTLSNGGELTHEELEDAMEMSKGLALSIGRDRDAGVLQMGVSVEHNFLERGVERNQYYCFDTSLVDRSFNSFLKNSEFYIMGRRDFDRFNSTIDYKVESLQTDIGGAALVPYAILEYLPSQVLIGTDSGIFIVDPTNVPAPFSVTGTFDVGSSGTPVYDLKTLGGQLMAVALDGLYELTPSGSIFTATKNAGNGLPDKTYVVSSLNNLWVMGTSDGIYYADSFSDPPYEIWYKASLVDESNVEQATGTCVAISSSGGTLYAGIGNSFYTSIDGKTWTKRYAFNKVDGEEVSILKLGLFAEQTFALTNKGLFTDNGSAKSSTVVFVASALAGIIETQFPDATTDEGKYKTYVGDLYVASDSMHVVGSVPYAYKLQSGTWTYEALGAESAHKIFVTSLGRRMAVVGNIILVE